jgi:hypothetical protein
MSLRNDLLPAAFSREWYFLNVPCTAERKLASSNLSTNSYSIYCRCNLPIREPVWCHPFCLSTLPILFHAVAATSEQETFVFLHCVPHEKQNLLFALRPSVRARQKKRIFMAQRTVMIRRREKMVGEGYDRADAGGDTVDGEAFKTKYMSGFLVIAVAYI